MDANSCRAYAVGKEQGQICGGQFPFLLQPSRDRHPAPLTWLESPITGHTEWGKFSEREARDPRGAVNDFD